MEEKKTLAEMLLLMSFVQIQQYKPFFSSFTVINTDTFNSDFSDVFRTGDFYAFLCIEMHNSSI